MVRRLPLMAAVGPPFVRAGVSKEGVEFATRRPYFERMRDFLTFGSVLGTLVAVIASVVGIFFWLRSRYFRDWRQLTPAAVPASAEGAYRAGPAIAGYTETPVGPPRALQVAAFISLVYGALGICAAPLAALGVVVDLVAWDQTKPGFALWFGPSGVALAIASLVVGIRIMKRHPKTRSLARVVAFWTMGHNAVLGAYGVLLLLLPHGESVGATQQCALDGSYFAVLVPLAIVAYVYAGVLFKALATHQALDQAMTEASDVLAVMQRPEERNPVNG